jgi:CheY-like chemotaxis protein
MQELARGTRSASELPVVNVPELKEASDALAKAHIEPDELLRRERELRTSAEHTNRSKDEFLAMLGHELRNPLAAMTAAAQVITVDIGLPGMDGYEVARNIRSRMDGEIRLIAMTGYGLPEDRLRATQAGFDEHLVKPLDEAKLMRAIGMSSVRML